MKSYKLFSIIVMSGLLVFSSCLKDLDTIPKDKDEITSATVFDTPESYKQFLAKIYGGLALTGQEGPAGAGDVAGIDEGESSYLRNLWVFEELTTDEAINHWGGDAGIFDFHNQNWSSSNKYVTGMYYRIFYQITLCNAFLRETSDEKLSDRGVGETLKAEIQMFRTEARFLRALSYWHALDFFGNVPFATEDQGIGAFYPEQISRADLFDYIETELLEIEVLLIDPQTNEYARADKAAAWTLLTKLYLNAEVYNNQNRYSDCITYCNKILNAGYVLETDYEDLFLANNHTASGIIFTIPFDGSNSQTYGGTTYIVNAAVGGSMPLSDFGVSGGGWAGNTTTSTFVSKFPDETGDIDARAMFYTDGQLLEIGEYANDFTQGYAISKWKNVYYTETDTILGSNNQYVDIDFPMFRIADIYLMYAEATLRDGGGDVGNAVGYINELRERAYGDASGNIVSGDLTLDFILDERSRELYWEGHRRTDLIRFDRFSNSSYVWPWKGGVQSGVSTDVKYDLFPIPASDISANPNLQQNPGY